ncbi:MAG: hypothetical protein GX025_10610 [Clostridiales bacterium]|nr:hypothetical protein [Clostridiales bacterium]
MDTISPNEQLALIYNNQIFVTNDKIDLTCKNGTSGIYTIIGIFCENNNPSRIRLRLKEMPPHISLYSATFAP